MLLLQGMFLKIIVARKLVQQHVFVEKITGQRFLQQKYLLPLHWGVQEILVFMRLMDVLVVILLHVLHHKHPVLVLPHQYLLGE